MPLTTYGEVFAYGEFIEYVTSTGYMPPWTPDEGYSHFVGERVLTEGEIATLGLATRVTDSIMVDPEAASRLAGVTLELAESLR